MKKTLLLLTLCAGLISCGSNSDVAFLDRIPTEGHNQNYVSTPSPMQPQSLISLPSGTIKPAGWLRTMLELQKDGLNGRLAEVSPWLDKEGNAWLNPENGKHGWEEVPYWIKGYSELAYCLDDKDMISESKFWIEAILNSQKENGNFGPISLSTDPNAKLDIWPNMLALWILQSYYEYSSDERVIGFMTNYCRFLASIPDELLLEDYWGNSRAGDNLWSVIWLYSRTQNPELLELAHKIHRNTANWTKPNTLPNWHNVNIAQCFREPATYFMVTKDSSMLRASYNVQRFIRQISGQVPGGMFGADENARLGSIDPRQAVEVCGMAEQACSDEMMLTFCSDPYWAENIEDVLFNTYPCSFSEDFKELRYFTAPNMVTSDTLNHSPGIQNAGPFYCISPVFGRCCHHNHGFAWPYYNNHLLYATPDDGIASVIFNSCSANILVADSKKIGVNITTDYPFDETITYEFSMEDSDATFPFYIRIPAWTKGATVSINGNSINAQAGKYMKISRTWKNGDKLVANFPMHISNRVWQANRNSVSIDYGPLTLSLKIKENTEKFCISKVSVISSSSRVMTMDEDKWPVYNITAGSPWNYSINPSTVSLKSKNKLQEGVNPFTQENIPLLFTAKGRIVPSWTIDEYNLCGMLPFDDDPRSDKVDDIELIPMGAARLRISAFPQCK